MRLNPIARSLAILALASACSTDGDDLANPFLEDMSNPGKEDTAYINPDGVEVEVDIEADIQAPSYKNADAPAYLAQFAMTYLRERGTFYLESLAEDSTSDGRVEWLVDGNWITAADARQVSADKLTHFRIRAMNAILLSGSASGATVGRVYAAKVPLKPYSLMSDVGDKCANPDGHITLDQSVYWYLWNPDRSGCTAAVQDMTVTISRMIPGNAVRYPEYDKLIADGKVTAVVLFGLIGDEMSESDTGFRALNRMATSLTQGGYQEITPAPLGRRFTKRVAAVDVEIDLYSPREFSGLGDYAHFDNLQKAISEHEIVAYDGHSMLGASDFWSRPTYPSFYQIFLYGGCLGYEYYVRPILNGKGGWDNLDILSSVVEVSADANRYAAPFLAKLTWALENNYAASWPDMLALIRKNVGDSTFGVSGARDNCFSPGGSLCGEDPDPSTAKTYENTTSTAIPDDNEGGILSTIEIPDSLVAQMVSLELDITHTYTGDLIITIEHNGVIHSVWSKEGRSNDDIRSTFVLSTFSGQDVQGVWTLNVADVAGQDVGTLNSWALIVQP